MAKFKCRLTGNVFEFVNDFDIKDMKKHPQYDEVKEVPKNVQVSETTKEVKKIFKKSKTKE